MTPHFWTLVIRLAAGADRDALTADLRDEFEHRARTEGNSSARRWYRRQVLRSVSPLVAQRFGRTIRHLAVGTRTLHDLRADLRFARRRALRRPLVPTVVIATMALGVGATTAVFSVADAVLLRPLPLPDSGRIVRFYGVLKNSGEVGSVNYFDMQDIARTSHTFRAVAMFNPQSTTWRTAAGPEPLGIVQAGPGYAAVLGQVPALGRDFTANEFSPGGPAAAIVTDQFWRRALGADADIIGRELDLDGVRTRIVGVLPPTSFSYPAAADLWVPLVVPKESYLNNRQSLGLSAIGRVRADRSVEQAQAELAVMVADLARAYPNQSGRRSLAMRPLADTVALPVRPTLVLLSAVVLAVLLLAATNIADLLAGDAATRQRKFAIRAAIGGHVGRLGRQALVESVVLAGVGGALGLALAPMVLGALVHFYPTPLPRLAEIAINARICALGLGVTLLAGLLTALPLIRSARAARLSDALRDGERGSSRRTRRLASGLVVAEVAISVALLAAGGVLMKTFLAAVRTDLGFTSSHVLTFAIDPSEAKYATPRQGDAFYATLLTELRAVPGVSAVGMTQFLPFTSGNWGDSFLRVGEPDRGPDAPEAAIHTVSDEFVEALGLRVVAGREFSKTDGAATTPVAMVNQSLARRYFGGAPLGREVVFQNQTWHIVGVVNDVHHVGVLDPPEPELYLPWAQFSRLSGWVVVRTTGLPTSVLPAVKGVLRAVDPTIALTKVSTMDERVAAAMGPERFRAAIAGSLGAAALLLAAIGLYGVMAHAVARRTPEIGLRLALGESPAGVRRWVMRDALSHAGAGVVLGALSAWWSAASLQTFLAQSNPHDAGVLGAVVVLVMGVAALSAWTPARRAAALDPVQVLRTLG